MPLGDMIIPSTFPIICSDFLPDPRPLLTFPRYKNETFTVGFGKMSGSMSGHVLPDAKGYIKSFTFDTQKSNVYAYHSLSLDDEDVIGFGWSVAGFNTLFEADVDKVIISRNASGNRVKGLRLDIPFPGAEKLIVYSKQTDYDPESRYKVSVLIPE